MARESYTAAVIVAHPDDEVLWCGGLILEHSDWSWSIVTLCRRSDDDRAGGFQHALRLFEANGKMGDLDDGPEQTPLAADEVEPALLELLPRRRFNLVLTHGPQGEYTRHRRHEECCRAVVSLWSRGEIETETLWLFAYEDGERAYLPRPCADADRRQRLSESLWNEKRNAITDVYGFSKQSWEARATPREESFWCFHDPARALEFVKARQTQP